MTKSTSFIQMNELAATVGIGSNELINLPFGNGSERMLNNQNLGTHFCNLNLNIHGQEHLFRSALEGYSFFICLWNGNNESRRYRYQYYSSRK